MLLLGLDFCIFLSPTLRAVSYTPYLQNLLLNFITDNDIRHSALVPTMPSPNPHSKLRVNFFPKSPQRRNKNSRSSLRQKSLPAAYKITAPILLSEEEPTHGFEYFPLWLGINALWSGIDWCFNQAFERLEAVTSFRESESQN